MYFDQQTGTLHAVRWLSKFTTAVVLCVDISTLFIISNNLYNCNISLFLQSQNISLAYRTKTVNFSVFIFKRLIDKYKYKYKYKF